VSRVAAPPPSLTRILFVRDDALGDALVSLPAILALREAFPEAELTILASPRNAWIYRRWSLPVAVSPLRLSATRRLIRRLRPQALICASPNPRVAPAALLEGVPLRLGYGRRPGGWCLNHPVWFGKRSSGVHEAALTLALLRPLGIHHRTITPPRLTPRTEALTRIRRLVADPAARLIIHPGGGGSAPNWSAPRYAEFIALALERLPGVVLTGTAAEADYNEKLSRTAPERIVSLTGETDLDELAALISLGRGFLSASTGPMHLAAALGVPQAALFSTEPHLAPRRWRPLNRRARIFASANLDDIRPVDVLEALLGTRPAQERR